MGQVRRVRSSKTQRYASQKWEAHAGATDLTNDLAYKIAFLNYYGGLEFHLKTSPAAFLAEARDPSPMPLGNGLD